MRDKPTVIILSIRHEEAERILDGTKTVEVRRTAPQRIIDRILLYDTSVRMVVGRVDVRGFGAGNPTRLWEEYGAGTLLTKEQYKAYVGERNRMCMLLLRDPARFADPRTLESYGVKHAPQSWMYLPEPKPRPRPFVPAPMPDDDEPEETNPFRLLLRKLERRCAGEAELEHDQHSHAGLTPEAAYVAGLDSACQLLAEIIETENPWTSA